MALTLKNIPKLENENNNNLPTWKLNTKKQKNPKKTSITSTNQFLNKNKNELEKERKLAEYRKKSEEYKKSKEIKNSQPINEGTNRLLKNQTIDDNTMLQMVTEIMDSDIDIHDKIIDIHNFYKTLNNADKIDICISIELDNDVLLKDTNKTPIIQLIGDWYIYKNFDTSYDTDKGLDRNTINYMQIFLNIIYDYDIVSEYISRQIGLAYAFKDLDKIPRFIEIQDYINDENNRGEYKDTYENMIKKTYHKNDGFNMLHMFLYNIKTDEIILYNGDVLIYNSETGKIEDTNETEDANQAEDANQDEQNVNTNDNDNIVCTEDEKGWKCKNKGTEIKSDKAGCVCKDGNTQLGGKRMRYTNKRKSHKRKSHKRKHRASKTRASKTRTSKTRTSKTRVSKTRVSKTRTSKTRVFKTRRIKKTH